METTKAAAPKDDTVVLSPFTVTTSNDKGYFAANTLAGSRLNTNLADLGASISVITKQQMDDTASTDINDIFRYEVNTEGSLTYTPNIQSSRNDGVIDSIAGASQGNFSSYTNAGANRVRGLGSPSAAVNYYPSISAVPFDAYNTQSIEISRGPNSMLFGLGSPAGIANQSTARALLNRDSASISFRTDQNGSFRSSVNFNQGLIHDKVAIYGAALYDDRRFQRKPSYDKTERYYAAITIKPFSKTTIRANFEKYDNDNHRPNSLTPRDYVTQWNLAGQPYYDSTTHTISSLKTGKALGMIVNNASSPYANALRDFIATLPGYDASKWNPAKTTYNGYSIFTEATGYMAMPGGTAAGAGYVAGQTSPNILYVPGIIAGGNDVHLNRSFMQIADGQLLGWYRTTYQYQYLTGFGTSTNPAANPTLYPSTSGATGVYANPTWSDYYTRSYTASGGWTAAGNGILGTAWRYPGVTDKSIYDWTDININSMNFGSASNKNYNVEFEQELPWDLYVNAGWFRQDYKSRNNYTVAQLNVATLYVDTNKYLPTGAANPYFGKTYVQDVDPDSYYNAELDDHYRAMIAWTPDFTRRNGWMKWLGRHQVLGLWSRDEYMATTLRQRLQYMSSTSDTGRYRFMNNPNNNADGTPTGWNYQSTSLRRTYYLASPNDPNGVVTKSAGYWDPMSFTGDIQVYDYDQSKFIPVNMTTQFSDFDANSGRSQRIIDSISAGTTSYFWDNRLVATVGFRQDKYRARNTNSGLAALTEADKTTIISPAITNAQKWVNGVYQRDFLFNRWDRWTRLTGRTRTIGGVLRPFQHWNSIDRKADDGSLLWQFVRDFGVSYNTSDNFNPPSQALNDFYGKALPKPTGDGKDYGIQFALFDNKLFARVTWFEASNENENISAPTVFSRLSSIMDQTLFRNWARTISLINLQASHPNDTRYNPIGSTNFGSGLSTAEETEVQAAAEKIWKLPYGYYETFARGATRNAVAKGVEAELNYNPTRSWTLKFTFGKQDTKYASVLKEFTPWNDDRTAVWKAAKATDYLLPQYQSYATYNTKVDGTGRAVNLTNFWSSFGWNSNVFPENGPGSPEGVYNRDVGPQLALDRDLQGQSVQGQRKYRWSFLSSYNFQAGRLKGLTVGGSVRWEDKAVIGYLGRSTGVSTNYYNGQPTLDYSDVTKPVYDGDHYYTDVFASYRFRTWNNKVGAKIQLNVANVFENGGLRPVAVNLDGSPYSYRIIDPRQFSLTTTFDF
ncbi:MAG: TonB-dependent receptor plug domain-containing protein [Opitutae bacterium]|nr:TonB-dependent receptor plug domain-containing protein [Opitutae bacterium]